MKRPLVRGSYLALAAILVIQPFSARLALAGPPPSAAPAPAAAPAERPLAEALQGAAKAAFEAANVLVANKDFEGASLKFQAAYAASKDPRLLFSVAICEKNLRHYVTMRALLEQYVREAGPRMSADSKASVDQALAASRDFVGTLRVNASEAGATVAIDGASVGTTPLPSTAPLDLGIHSVVVRKDGFVPFEKSVTIAGGNELTVTATLVKVAVVVHDAHLIVRAAPTAQVAVDNGVEAPGGFDGRLSIGSHVLSVREDGKISRQTTVELHDGETQTLEITLDPVPHRALWPWLVGGGAVLVAGAVLGGYFATRPASAATLSTPPGQSSVGTFHLSSVHR
jgi:hypothetical protein